MGLEEGLASQIEAAEAEGVSILTAGDVIEVLDYAPDTDAAPDADVDAGATAGAADPHFWTDPTQMVAVVDALEASAIEHIEGVDAAVISANTDDYTAELEALDAEMEASFASIPAQSRNLVTNHHVFGYLANRYEFELIGAVIPGGSTLAAPSASDLRDLVEAITEAGVPTIFAESSQPDRLIQVLADEAGIDVGVVELFTESLSQTSPGADTYLTMMRTNMQRITTGLSP
jgi:zinc/manganese transport system substrate-binding protein